MTAHRNPLLIVFTLSSLLSAGSAAAREPDWSLYEALLQDRLSQESRYGTILNWLDYSGLQGDSRWRMVVDELAAFPIEHLDGRDEYLSFYINAYNILAIDTVLRNWPLESIKDAGSLFRPVWGRDAGLIGGKLVSLDTVEHEILRQLKEPRIHFAIVCASVSCPDLRMEPYRAGRLSVQLDEQVRSFLINPGKGMRNEQGELRVSRIFDWFAEDFAEAGGIEAFILRYVKLPRHHRLNADLPYDWRLNGD